MDGRTNPRATDRVIADLAARQHGVVGRWQLLALGIGRGAIESRLRTGRLRRVRHGVYAVGHTALSPDAHSMSAVLACGPGTVLSHRSAAAVWGIRPSSVARVEVSVADRGVRRLAGIVVHRARSLPGDETTTRCGLPVTTVARTLLDLADVVDAEGLRRAVKRAETERLFDLRAIETLIERHPNRATRTLRRAIGAYDPTLTRSELEARFLALCRQHGLPRPQVNALVAGHEADVLWPEHRLAVELDSWHHHGTRTPFEDDRRRDADLLLAGVRTLRVTDRRLTEAPHDVVATLRRLLAVSLPAL